MSEAATTPQAPRRETPAFVADKPRMTAPADADDLPVTARPPEAKREPVAAAPAVAAPKLPDGWYDILDAPQDGKAIEVLGPGGEVVETVWRNTRFYDRYNGGRWQIRGFWAVRNAGGTPVPFAPIGFRPL